MYTNQGWFAATPINPGIPTSVVATNSGSGRAFNNGRASVAFNVGTDGGLPTSFTVTSSPGSYAASGSTSPILVTGLQSSTQYTYTVTATNNFGTSLSSPASTAVTASTVPAAPSLSAEARNSSATLTITPGATGGSAITEYSIVSNPATTTQTTSNTTYTFTGLTNGTSYTFTATAINANGTSAASAATSSVTPSSTVTVDYLVIAGGVAANSRLRELAKQKCEKAGVNLRIPSPGLCTDNGAMVAALGSLMSSAGRASSSVDFSASSSLSVTAVSVN
jgi:hypothetical protein